MTYLSTLYCNVLTLPRSKQYYSKVHKLTRLPVKAGKAFSGRRRDVVMKMNIIDTVEHHSVHRRMVLQCIMQI